MLDPLAALGLASNIVQLITFTSDLVSKSREHYDSAFGGLVEHLELEAITLNLQNLSCDLTIPTNSNTKEKITETETETQLSQLCTGCREISQELLSTIQGLRTDGPNTRWNSFRQALRSVWNEDKITALEVRLNRYRSQIDTTLLISIRESIDCLPQSERQSERVSQLVLDSTRNQERVTKRGLDLKHLSGIKRLLGLKQLEKSPEAEGESYIEQAGQVKQWQTELVDEVHQGDLRFHNEKDLVRFSAKLSASTKEDRDHLVKQHIMEELCFGSMKDRAERIPEAYSKTFDWIFQKSKVPAKHPQPEWSNFVHWLESDSNLYWVTGKPGSGKSTLMKYLQSDSRTLNYLDPWLDGQPLTVAGYFFWNSGTAMQRSKLGLLQTLLHEAIEKNLDAIPAVLPRRWRSYQSFGGDLHQWSMSELVQAFDILISDEARKFFFLIDGLDEFDGDGAELVNFIFESISSRKNVKFCVASRPWLVFEDGFQRKPSLRLEDLTAPDIKLFVTEKLEKSDMFVRLGNLDHSNTTLLVTEVTEKASGVFLWVQLVVLTLLEGLRDGDDIADLQARLLLIPPDLEDLFEKMLRGLKPAYFEQASMYFQILQASIEPPTLAFLSFAEEGFEKALSTKIGPESSEEQGFRAERMRRRLSSRCQGLLEAPAVGFEADQAKVQYLHRTVKDYISQKDVSEFVASGTKESFNLNMALCAAWLRSLKVMECTTSVNILESFWGSFRHCVDCTVKFKDTEQDLQISVLDELSKVGDYTFEREGDHGKTYVQGAICSSHWTTTEYSGVPGKAPAERTTCFLDYAFLYPLHKYVEHKLRNGASPNIQIVGHSLLYKASCTTNVPLVTLLLDLGVDPNLCQAPTGGERHCSTWQQFLATAKRTMVTSPESLARMADIVQLFLEHGADASVQIPVENLTVANLIKQLFQHWDPARTEEILNKVLAAKKREKGGKPRGIKRLSHLWGRSAI